jgi:hypothetical protein
MTVTLFSSSEDLYSGIALPRVPSRDCACWEYISAESRDLPCGVMMLELSEAGREYAEGENGLW